jgi:STE24 endopeptidase
MTEGLDLLDLPGLGRRVGRWRALVALPAMIASALLLLVLFGWAGQWEPLIMVSWLTCGLFSLTRSGERIAVRLGCRFRRPSPDERAALDPVWTQGLTRCGIDADRFDLYIQRSDVMNAYATGGRSVAVTSRVLREQRAGRLGDQMMSGILGHELGHHVTAGARFGPVIAWFSLPWRCASRFVLRAAMRLAGHQPRAALAVVVIATFAVAIVQASQQRQWSTVVILGALSVFPLVVPLADAALSRVGERAADRYAAALGYGEGLTRALRILNDKSRRRGSALAILASHPRTERRIHEVAARRSGKRSARARVR